MEKIKERYDLMQKALLTLQKGLSQLEDCKEKNQRVYALMRDGIVQRFEYSIDSFWKFG